MLPPPIRPQQFRPCRVGCHSAIVVQAYHSQECRAVGLEVPHFVFSGPLLDVWMETASILHRAARFGRWVDACVWRMRPGRPYPRPRTPNARASSSSPAPSQISAGWKVCIAGSLREVKAMVRPEP